MFHCFIGQESDPYEWFEKEFHPKLIHSKENKSREEFIESIKKDPIVLFPSVVFKPNEKRDFERFPPFIFDREYRISYAETFNKFLQAKNEGKRIYNYIRLYDFAANLSQVNTLYGNDALSLSLIYTVLDALLKEGPKHCSKRLECDSCGRTDVIHNVESLASYQNRRIGDLLVSQERSIIEDYQKLLKKMNRIRGETYHGAIFFSIFDEWLREAKKISGKKEGTTEKWPLERIIREFKTSYLAKSQAKWLFGSFIRSLLINELVGDRYYPKLLMNLIT